MPFGRFLSVRIEKRVLLTGDLLPYISLVVGQSSVNISLALRTHEISTTTDLQPVIYWATNHCKQVSIS